MSAQVSQKGKCKEPAAPAQSLSPDMQVAVSVLRVSTKKQLDGEGIENQRRGNNDYIRRKGYHLLKEFEIAESADDSDRDKERKDFTAVIAEIVQHKHEIDLVVFWKIDRITRGGALPFFELKAFLGKHGIRVESATEPIDESPAGELMQTMLVGMSRFENRLRVDRTIGAEKILTREGHWCRAAPTGFRNARNADGRPILLPSEDAGQWELLRYGLKKQLTGVFTLSEVAAELREKGFKTNKGNPISPQTWHKMCQRSVYGGLICEQWTGGQFIRAKFDGPLTPDEWHCLQDVLQGKKRTAAPVPRQHIHPDFPLRRFLRCPCCESPARGYSARGRHGGFFPYYDCQSSGCAFRVRAGEAHGQFVELLRAVTPSSGLLDLLREVALRAWGEQMRELKAHGEVSRKSADDLDQEKKSILTLMKRSAENPVLLRALEEDFTRVERELSLTRLTKEPGELEQYDSEKVVNHCVGCMQRVSELWQEWPVEGQSRIQRLVLPQGVTYDVLTGNRTPHLSLVYAIIPNLSARKSTMAAPCIRVTNPIIPEMVRWWQETQEWFLTL